ncbi:hypothetical protein BJY04DRAFT_183408 [Aspergillus karnatakaensis]|uniref:uncharacterized protein n=1 Tax=Aspergillus karnatakaensis TaxID=1810916 RepID=UPI003CCD3C85
MKGLKSAAKKPVTLFYSNHYFTPPHAQRYLLQWFHPVRPKIQHMCDNRSKNALWWRVSTKEIVPWKRVIRSWCARRVRSVFEEELKERGYDAEGNRLRISSRDPAFGPLPSRDLRGSVTLYIQPECITQKYPALREHMKSLVDHLVAQQGKQAPRGQQRQRDNQSQSQGQRENRQQHQFQHQKKTNFEEEPQQDNQGQRHNRQQHQFQHQNKMNHEEEPPKLAKPKLGMKPIIIGKRKESS